MDTDRVTRSGEPRVLLIHWGRRNAGPLLLREYAVALHAALGSRLRVSGNPEVEAAVRPPAAVRAFDVRTYSGAAGAVLGLPRLALTAVRLRRAIRRDGVTAVFAPMYSLWQTLSLPVWLPRDVRYVTTVHDAVNHPGMRNPVIDLCRAIELRRADAVVVYSAEVQRRVEAGLRRRVPVARLELGAPPATTPRLAPRSTPVIGFFGRLLAYKGVEQYVDALRLLHEDRSVQGAVHGRGDVSPALVERAGELVDWRLDYLPEERIMPVLAGFDLLVLPYQEASQSGVVLQAFAAGLPVVATPVGGLREQVEGRGGVIAAGTDAASIAAAVRSVLDDPSLYSRLSAQAIASAQELGWARVAAPLLPLLLGPSR